MEIKSQGRTYELTDRPISLKSLMDNAGGNECAQHQIEGMIRFLGTGQILSPWYEFSLPFIERTGLNGWAVNDPERLCWLVANGYLEETTEKTYRVNTWFKWANELLFFARTGYKTASMVHVENTPENNQYHGESVTFEDADRITLQEMQGKFSAFPREYILVSPPKIMESKTEREANDQ